MVPGGAGGQQPKWCQRACSEGQGSQSQASEEMGRENLLGQGGAVQILLQP